MDDVGDGGGFGLVGLRQPLDVPETDVDVLFGPLERIDDGLQSRAGASGRPRVPKKQPSRSSVPSKRLQELAATDADEVAEREIRSRSAAMADSLIPSLRTLMSGTFDGLLAW